MSEDHKKTLQTQLWNIANTLRGKMGADEFRDYILGFIFYKYLSERMHLFADEILKHDGIQFDFIDEDTKKGAELLAAIKEEAIERLGYFLKPTELFHKVAEKGAQKTDNFILEDLTAVLKHIEASTMGHASEDDFEGLFEDLDLRLVQARQNREPEKRTHRQGSRPPRQDRLPSRRYRGRRAGRCL